jgi:hypothetical protein
MNCLENHIGIKYCNSPESVSGLYVNQLPGITLESLEKISEKENINFMGMWKEVKTRAWMRLEKDLRVALRAKYKLKSVKANAKVSGILDEDDTVVADEKLRGVVIDLGINTAFIAIGISSFSIKLPNTVSSLNVKVFDAEGTVLESISKANAPAGKNTFLLGKKYLSSKVFIAVDSTAVELYTSRLTKASADSCCSCVREICDDCSPTVYGAEADLPTPGDPIEGYNLFGFEVDYSVLCDYSSIICRNKPEFTDTWLYLLGTELMNERLWSTRLNRFTTIDKESAADMRDYFGSEYERSLSESIAALDVAEDECCIVCNPAIASRYNLP